MIALFIWHGAERIYLTLHDMHAGGKVVLMWICYGIAGALTHLRRLGDHWILAPFSNVRKSDWASAALSIGGEECEHGETVDAVRVGSGT